VIGFASTANDFGQPTRYPIGLTLIVSVSDDAPKETYHGYFQSA
jgi:hypothetical protein